MVSASNIISFKLLWNTVFYVINFKKLMTKPQAKAIELRLFIMLISSYKFILLELKIFNKFLLNEAATVFFSIFVLHNLNIYFLLFFITYYRNLLMCIFLVNVISAHKKVKKMKK